MEIQSECVRKVECWNSLSLHGYIQTNTNTQSLSFLSFLGKSKDVVQFLVITYRWRFNTCRLYSSVSPLLRKGYPVRKERWYGNKSSSFACGSHGYNSKLTGQGHPVHLHCILSIIQSSHLDFTRSEVFTWPSMEVSLLSFWLRLCPRFFPLFRVALYAHIYVQSSSHCTLLDLCDSIFADCMQMLRISQSNAFVLKRFIRYTI